MRPSTFLFAFAVLAFVPARRALAQTETSPPAVSAPQVMLQCEVVPASPVEAEPAPTTPPPAPPSPLAEPVTKHIDEAPSPIVVIELSTLPFVPPSAPPRTDALEPPTADGLRRATQQRRRARRLGAFVGLGYATWLTGLATALSTCWRYGYGYAYDEGFDPCAAGWQAFGIGMAAQAVATFGLALSSLRTAKWLQRRGVRIARWRGALAIPLSFTPYTSWLAAIFAGRQARHNGRAIEAWRASAEGRDPSGRDLRSP